MGKVYCGDCRFYLSSFFAGGDLCGHESNIKCRDTYYTVIKDYIGKPEKLNSDNDCKNYEKIIERPIDENLNEHAKLILRRFLGI